MLRIILPITFLLLAFSSMAKTIVVKNPEELKKANAAAMPGDIIILQNGVWPDITIALNCNGTREQPITFKAATPGKVFITGNSKLKLGGSFIIVDGFYFEKGYAGEDAIIKFSIDKKQVANYCRVTNTVINDFNNPKRLDENYWVALYGKNNRIDHCSFLNKKNLGVMMAVILEDERSRENYHSIDHNYFGFRLPLASNSGEIIRIGVSEHCEFNSNTQIVDNFFEHCDGETEIISIKSCHNLVRNNLFKECQGGVVLRHGHYNTVQNNVFLGNDKAGTGGVRIINRGQWVINNLFYKCRGEDFRAPLSIMNGVPNSPANRYVGVADAVIANNSFYECTPISFCEGSDAERSEAPHNVQFLNNIFFNSKDSLLYHQYDNISGISFSGNMVSKTILQPLTNGFIKTVAKVSMQDGILFPDFKKRQENAVSDSLQIAAMERLKSQLTSVPGFSDAALFSSVKKNAATACGAKWFNQNDLQKPGNTKKVDCKNAEEILLALETNKDAGLTINLTGEAYTFSTPLTIGTNLTISSAKKQPIKFVMPFSNAAYCLLLKAGSTLSMQDLMLDLSGASATAFISTDTSGSSNHSNFSFINCAIRNINGIFFTAAKSSVSDSIIINNCSFNNGNGTLFSFKEETDKKGFYNLEKLKITNSSITNQKGQLLTAIRSGTDESTMGPLVIFSNNKISNCTVNTSDPLIYLYGVQHSFIEKNIFLNCNKEKTLIAFNDAVRAAHLFRNNSLTNSGTVLQDKFVQAQNNRIQ